MKQIPKTKKPITLSLEEINARVKQNITSEMVSHTDAKFKVPVLTIRTLLSGIKIRL